MKIYYFNHDCRSFYYDVCVASGYKIINIHGQKFAQSIRHDWIQSIPESRFALTKKEIIEKVRAMAKDDLKFLEKEYLERKEYLNDLLDNDLEITKI